MQLICHVVAAVAAAAQSVSTPTAAVSADLVVVNAKIATLDQQRPAASALAVKGGKFIAVGEEADVRKLQGPETKAIDAGGRTIIPGLNDSHLHAVRGGRFYNLELRWDGVKSLKRGLEMIREQAARTPKGQWVRVIGGWSPYQFEERRMPTVAELNEAAPTTPVFVLFLYSQALMNKAGRGGAEAHCPTAKLPKAGGTNSSKAAGVILHAEPNPMILYSTIARLPELSAEEQLNSAQHFYRELNRFGLTSASDTGGGGHVYPANYESSQ